MFKNSMRSPLPSLLQLLVLPLLMAACRGDAGERTDQTDEQVPRLPSTEMGTLSEDRVRLTLPWGSGSIRNQGVEGDSVGVLLSLTASSEAAFDRIMVEFAGPPSAVGYEIVPGDGPIEGCEGPASSSSVPGESWLNVRFVRLQSSREVAERISEGPELETIREVRLACADGSRLAFALRLAHPGRHRVTEAAGPSAVAIDVEH